MIGPEQPIRNTEDNTQVPPERQEAAREFFRKYFPEFGDHWFADPERLHNLDTTYLPERIADAPKHVEAVSVGSSLERSVGYPISPDELRIFCEDAYIYLVNFLLSSLEGEQKTRAVASLADLAESYRVSLARGMYTSFSRYYPIEDEDYWAVGREEKYIKKESGKGEFILDGVPGDIVTNPVEITNQDVEIIVAKSSLEEKLAVLADLADPHRCRVDQDAPEEHREILAKDQLAIVAILNSLPDGPKRDMAAIFVWIYANHRNVGNDILSRQSINLINNTDIVEQLEDFGKDKKPWEVFVKWVRGSSHDVLNNALERAKRLARNRGSRLNPRKYHQENYGVSVNRSIESLRAIFFNNRRFLTLRESKSSRGSAEDSFRRDKESEWGLIGYNPLQPRPIYGTAISGEIQRVLGGFGELRTDYRKQKEPYTGPYGECSIKIKDKVVSDRVTFTMYDSMSGGTVQQRDWATGKRLSHNRSFISSDDYVEAKDLLDAQEDIKSSAYPYLEAQIHGGLEVEDIESISIPIDYSQSGFITAIRENYPSIKLIVYCTRSHLWDNRERDVGNLATELGFEFVMLD